MRKLILAAIVMIAALSSCITQQKCNERFPPKESDSVSTSTTHKDSIVYVPFALPAKEVAIHDTIIKCPELEYHSEKHENGIDLKVDIDKGIINSSAKTDSIDTTAIAHVDITENIIKEKKESKETITKCELTKWQSFLIVCGYLFWISWLLFTLFIVVRLYLKK